MKKLIWVVLLLVSCTKFPGFSRVAEKSPDETIREFLKLSAEATSVKDKRVISEMCHGELKRIFERMSDEMFTMSYLSRQVVLDGIRILESNIDKDIARIRYEVKAQNKQGTDPTIEINTREVELTKVDGQWRIDSIRPRGSDQIAFSRGMVF